MSIFFIRILRPRPTPPIYFGLVKNIYYSTKANMGGVYKLDLYINYYKYNYFYNNFGALGGT